MLLLLIQHRGPVPKNRYDIRVSIEYDDTPVVNQDSSVVELDSPGDELNFVVGQT